ncbi:MAG TPA: nucleotidyltransferase family protein [Armatimonadota bacterium]|nr:nucleotidyltransferase family protein [Armatimonadota bacterium]
MSDPRTIAEGLPSTGLDTTCSFDAVLPAGGRIKGAFAESAGTDIKALIRLNGETILWRTIAALRETGRCGRVVVVGPQETLKEALEAGADGSLIEGPTGPDNICAGLEWLVSQDPPRPSRTLVVTTDMPFLTAAAIERFVDACPADAELSLPIITRQAFETLFPESGNVFVRLLDGEFTLGGAFLLTPQAVLNNRRHIERIFKARKSQVGMVRLLGFSCAARFLCRRLTVAHVERRASHLLGLRGAAVKNAPAELAFDIDLPEEYDYVLRHQTR